MTVVQHLQCKGSEILKFLLLPGEALFLQDGEGLHLSSVRRDGLLSCSRYKATVGMSTRPPKQGDCGASLTDPELNWILEALS